VKEKALGSETTHQSFLSGLVNYNLMLQRIFEQTVMGVNISE
jgi:hypothetical protein